MDARVIQFDESANYIKSQAPNFDFTSAMGVILGSGLGRLADEIENPIVIPYHTIPNFKKSTAVGHKGNMICGTLCGRNIVAMQGRFHYYEGYTMQEVTFPVRVMSRLGVATLFVSNAAGAVNPDFKVGDLMIITDHINLLPNPLIGPNIEEMGPRFPDMTTTYSKRIRKIALMQAQSMGLPLQQGIYVGGTGPSYETLAEYKFFRTIGGDAVGMSTVPEVIVARHCGMEIFGMSVITNQAQDLNDEVLNDGDDVVKAADAATSKMITLFKGIISQL